MVSLRGVNKHFGLLHVLKDIDLTREPGQVVVLIGPSGAGKSTLVNAITGALGPGRLVTGMPASRASRTNLYPGSDTSGVPASLTSTTALSRIESSNRARASAPL